MFVLAPVSSRNTSLATSSSGCLSFQASRAALTSSRSCSLACRVFFKAQPPPVELMPERRRLDGHAVSGQTFAHLGQREIGLRGNPLAYLQFPIRHPGAPISAKATAGAFTLLFIARFDLINPTRVTSRRRAMSTGRSPRSSPRNTRSRKSCEYAAIHPSINIGSIT